MQKCRVNMTKRSFLNDLSVTKENFLADLIEMNGRLQFRYKENNDDASVQITSDTESVEIIRHGEVISKIILQLGTVNSVLIESVYGVIEMESYTISINRSQGCLNVEYQLLQQDDIVDHYKISWQILKEDLS